MERARVAVLTTPLSGAWRNQLSLFLMAYMVYNLARWGFTGDLGQARDHARWIVELEQSAGLALESSVQRSLDSDAAIWLASNVYLAAQLVVLPGALIWLYRRSPEVYRPLRNTILATWLIAVPIYAIFPVAPPRLADLGIADTVSQQTGVALSGRSTIFYNELAAVPSLHVGFAAAITVALAIASRTIPRKAMALLWAPAVAVAVVATGNHFIVDIVAGLAVTALGFLVGRLPARFAEYPTRGSVPARRTVPRRGVLPSLRIGSASGQTRVGSIGIDETARHRLVDAPKRVVLLSTRPTPRRTPSMNTATTVGQITPTKHRFLEVDGLDIFYREAGDPDRPTLLLLHGFPTSSQMYRNLIPRLSDRYHLVAPDYPSFGHSSFPSADEFDYSFESLYELILKFIDQLGVERFSVYIQDYGAPIGLRLAQRNPERIEAIVTQSGNAYMEGFTPFWEPLFAYATDPNPETEAEVSKYLTHEANVWQWTHGTRDPESVSPDTWTLDDANLDRPGNREIQLGLFRDYKNNLDGYPAFQQYFRDYKPPTLIVWGRNDEIFGPKGAEAYLRDLPDAELHLLDTGHFALEEDVDFIAERIRDFLGRSVG